jgi:hypothetical protein
MLFNIFERNKNRKNEDKLSGEQMKKVVDVFNALVLYKRKVEAKDMDNLDGLADKILADYLHFFKFFMYKDFLRRKLKHVSKESRVKVLKEIRESQKRYLAVVEFFKLASKHDVVSEELKESELKSIFTKVHLWYKDFDDLYFEYGFSPRISNLLQGINCFGFVQILGAVLLKAGFEVKMAIGVNHPYCLVKIGQKIQMLSLYGLESFPEKFIQESEKGIFADFRNSKKEDAPDMNLGDGDEKFFIICDFKLGVVYEMLEQFKAYKAIKEGGATLSLPDFDADMKTSFVDRLYEDLEGVDWGMVQDKIIPKLSKMFKECERILSEEYHRILPRYEKSQAEKFLGQVFDKYYYKLFHIVGDQVKSVANADKFRSSERAKVRNALALYYDPVLNYLEKDVPLGGEVPLFLSNFIYEVKDEINKIENVETRKRVFERFLKPIKGHQEDPFKFDEV